MRLLIVTQTLDEKDPVLGFFVRWVAEFSVQCEEVTVLALNVGEYSFPKNVTVVGLGKSEGKGKLVQLRRLWQHSFYRRHHYDAVFCHMNPEYVLYGAAVWKLLRKPIGLWYAHGAVSTKLKIATALSDHIFTSTSNGFRLNSPKCHIVGQGIDTAHFTPGTRTFMEDGVLRLITVGRVSKSKQLETLIEATALLHADGVPVTFTIIGAPQTEIDQQYQQTLKQLTSERGVSDIVSFSGPVTQQDLPAQLQQHDIFISDGQTGSLDKALLEALACGIITISSNQAYVDFVKNDADIIFVKGDPVSLLERIHGSIVKKPFLMSEIKRKHSAIIDNYAIGSLIHRIVLRYERNIEVQK